VEEIGERSLSEEKLNNILDIFWPYLEKKLKIFIGEQPEPEPVISELEILEEILEFIRTQGREKSLERERNQAL